MNLDAYLEKLRAKPDHEKKRLAFWTAFGTTGVIAAFWLVSITGINIIPGGATNDMSAAVINAGSPADSLVAAVGGFAGDIWSMITGPKTIHYAEIQATPGTK